MQHSAKLVLCAVQKLEDLVKKAWKNHLENLVQKCLNLVDVEKTYCCKVNIYFQKSASIQLRTRSDKFARLFRAREP